MNHPITEFLKSYDILREPPLSTHMICLKVSYLKMQGNYGYQKCVDTGFLAAIEWPAQAFKIPDTFGYEAIPDAKERLPPFL